MSDHDEPKPDGRRQLASFLASAARSLAAMLYGLPSVGWAHPDLHDERQCEPADWWRWPEARSWVVAGQ